MARSTFSKSKCTKHTNVGALLEVEMSKKCTPLRREAHFQVKSVKNYKKLTGSEHFWTFRCRFARQAQGIVHLVKKRAKREGFVDFRNISKNDGRRGTFEEDLQRCIFRGKRRTKKNLHQSC